MSHHLAGKIQKPFGAGGELLIVPNGSGGQWECGQAFFVSMDGLWTPFFVKSIKDQAARKIVVFENMESPRLAQMLAGKDLYIEASDGETPQSAQTTPQPCKYVGYAVINDGQHIGTIRQCLDFNGNVCFEIKADDGSCRLIPAHPDFVVRASQRRRTLYMRLPDGILG